MSDGAGTQIKTLDDRIRKLETFPDLPSQAHDLDVRLRKLELNPDLPTRLFAVEKYEERIQKLERDRYILITLAVVFGISGAFGGKILYDASAKLNSLQDGIAAVQKASNSAQLELQQAKERQLDDLQKRAIPLIKDEIGQQFGAELGKAKYWSAYVYFSAARTGLPNGGGANGWWQDDLIKKADVVKRDLGLEDQLK